MMAAAWRGPFSSTRRIALESPRSSVCRDDPDPLDRSDWGEEPWLLPRPPDERPFDGEAEGRPEVEERLEAEESRGLSVDRLRFAPRPRLEEAVCADREPSDLGFPAFFRDACSEAALPPRRGFTAGAAFAFFLGESIVSGERLPKLRRIFLSTSHHRPLCSSSKQENACA